MALAVCIEKPNTIIRRRVANGVAIPKGTLLQLADPNLASPTSATGQVFGGISIEEKVANDGIVEIGVALDGVWDLRDSGTGFAVGSTVSVGGPNLIKLATAGELLTGAVIGKSEETASASEVVRVRLGGI